VLVLEFRSSKVSKFVEAKFIRLALSVVLEDLVVVLNKDGISGSIFFGSVGFCMVNLPGGPESGELIEMREGSEAREA